MPTLITLATFDSSNPFTSGGISGGLTMDAAGNLIGAQWKGGLTGYGSIFELTRDGTGYATTPTVMVSFTGPNGDEKDPNGSLVIDSNGNLLGTTGYLTGSVYEIAKTADGYASNANFVTTFGGSGSLPSALIIDAAGNLYGTTNQGGPNGYGTAFEIPKTDAGYAAQPTTLVSFPFASRSGYSPLGPLAMDAAGDLFGVTSGGGASDAGTIFEIAKTSTGYAAPINLFQFDVSHGAKPSTGLIIDAAGDLFGTTAGEGTNSSVVFELAMTATGYASTPTILAKFTSQATLPSGLVMDAAGNLYGTTQTGGAYNDGSVFEIAKSGNGYGALTTLIDFNGSNGATPNGPLILGQDGNLYGTTSGPSGTGGTIFEVALSTTPDLASISGTAQEGQILTAGANVDVAAYQWQVLLGGIWTDIAGATQSTYQAAPWDDGRQLRVEVTDDLGNIAMSAATNAVLDAAGNQSVYESAFQTTIGSGQWQYVFGKATDTVIKSGGEQNIYASGEAINTILSAGTSQVDWGSAVNTLVNGNQFVWGTATGTQVNSAGVEYVEAGASDLGTTVVTGGEQVIAVGATATAASVLGGTQYVYGTADQTIVGDTSPSYGNQYVYGTATNTTVIAAYQNVYAGGSAIGTTLTGFSFHYQSFFSVTYPLGSTQIVWGTAVNTTMTYASRQYVYGTAINTTISLDLQGYNIAFDHGGQYVEAGGSATGTTVNSNCQQTVYGGGAASNTTLSGGSQYVSGSADQTVVGNGSFQYVYGSATNATVNYGGGQNVYANGTASTTTLNTGSVQTDWGTATNTTLDGGNQYVFGSASQTLINAGAQYVETGGSATDTTIDSGGQQSVDGGTASNTIIAGGIQAVTGTADQTEIDSGGFQYVFGSATNTTVNDGGEQNIYVGGTASTTTLNAGGTQIDWGTATNTTLNGGNQFVFGSASHTLINAGTQYVEAGGSASDSTIGSGATETVYTGGTANGVSFAGSNAALILDQGSNFTGTVAGWQSGDNIDLRSIVFGDNTTLAYADSADHSGGTLTISDGTHVATLALLGQYMATDFALSFDGHGGTSVIDPATASQPQTHLAAAL